MADTELTREPVCPLCGYVERDAWEIDFGGIEGETVHTCLSCSQDYSLSKTVTTYYTSEKLGDDSREAGSEDEP